MEVLIKAKYCNETVDLSFSKYGNGATAIQATSLEGEPLFTATVALELKPRKGYVLLKGWSENEGIPEYNPNWILRSARS